MRHRWGRGRVHVHHARDARVNRKRSPQRSEQILALVIAVHRHMQVGKALGGELEVAQHLGGAVLLGGAGPQLEYLEGGLRPAARLVAICSDRSVA